MFVGRQRPARGGDSRARSAVVIHRELLRAARCGDCKGLERVLSPENGAAAAAQLAAVIVDVGEGDTTDIDVVAAGTSKSAPRHKSIEEEVAAADGQQQQHAPLSLLEGVTYRGDSALHVVAASGDSPAFLECARMIYDKAKHLLHLPNNKGDTPLHRAARGGHTEMVSRLAALAKDEGAGNVDGSVLKKLLTKLNERRETALHEAVRFDNKELVDKLMSLCPELARFPQDGTSALYLAISLGHDHIVEELHMKDKGLSYSGPAGQNALHAAVLHGTAMTTKILKWNKDTTRQVDESGSTPLHFAASAEGLEMEETSSFITRFLFLRSRHNPTPTELLLEAEPSLAYQPDNRGQYPIHVATSMGKLELVALILDKCPECAGLRDARGRTFLHVAVDKRKQNIVNFATKGQRFASILNMKDNDGNTALHLAVLVGILRIFRYLLRNQRVFLSLINNEGKTPADLARSTIPAGLYYKTNARMWILWLLVKAKARNGNDRRDHFQEKYIPELNESEESKKMTESTQIIGIGSVLVATMAFAAAFTLPGGYIANDQRNGGTPTLAGSYIFDAFIYAISVAFICSMLATFSLIYSGMSAVDWMIRYSYFNHSLFWMWNSTRSLLVAFALGVYLVLAPVADTTAVGVCLLSSGTLLFRNREVGRILICTYTLQKRVGITIWLRLATQILTIILQSYLVYVVIFVSPACFHGILKHIPMVHSS